MHPDMTIAARLFAELERHWRVEDEHQGMYRPCYHAAEEEAIAACVKEALALGLRAFKDMAGNVYMLLEGSDPLLPIVLSGSHVDSVPFGGRYDGTAGVVAALAAIGGIRNSDMQLPHGVCAMICRGEESAWFGQVSIGSKSAVGELPATALMRSNPFDNNITLAEAMSKLGLSGTALVQGTKLLSPDHIGSYVELHIEQGPSLDSRGIPVGIVTGIRGNVRFPKIICNGEAGHTGTVPHAMRRDAVRATCQLLYSIEQTCLEMQSKGHDLVFTFPILRTSPAASLTTIPDFCECAIEVRSESSDVLNACERLVSQMMSEIATRYQVEFTLATLPTRSAPAVMATEVQSTLALHAKHMSIPVMSVPSGAGHDAAVFANSGIPSGMIFIRHDGISHRHDETMDMQDFAMGTSLLMRYMCEPTGMTRQSSSFVETLLHTGASEL